MLSDALYGAGVFFLALGLAACLLARTAGHKAVWRRREVVAIVMGLACGAIADLLTRLPWVPP